MEMIGVSATKETQPKACVIIFPPTVWQAPMARGRTKALIITPLATPPESNAIPVKNLGMKKESPDEDIDTGFRMLEQYSTNIFVAYDKTTGVMYIVNYHGGVTPIINADGSPRIWEGEK